MRFLFVASAGVSVTITPDAGAVTLAGYAPIIAQTANQWVTPNAGSLAISGSAPTVSRTANQWVTPDAGFVVLTGFAPSLDYSYTITPAAGAVVLVGAAPTVAATANQWVTPNAGALTLTGYAPVISATANKSTTPDAGAVVLAGSAPVLGYSYAITPDAGALTITSSAPVVVRTANQWITPGAGALVLAGAEPTLAEHQIARPASDVTTGAWVPSTGSDLYATMDEANVDDGDYIYTAYNAAESEVALSSLNDPASSTGHTLRYRVIGNGASGITVSLICGSTVIATWTHDPAPGTWTTYAQTLSAGEADAITDYSDLRVRFYEYAPLLEEDADYLVTEGGENLMAENDG